MSDLCDISVGQALYIIVQQLPKKTNEREECILTIWHYVVLVSSHALYKHNTAVTIRL
jgi:hypothetical protein